MKMGTGWWPIVTNCRQMNRKTLLAALALLLFLLTCFPGTSKLYAANANGKMLIVRAGDSIQKAINEAERDATITVQEGSYHEQLVINKPLKLQAANNAKVMLSGNHQGHVITITASGVSLSGFQINQSGNKKQDAGIYIASSDNLIVSNTLSRVQNGIYVNKGHGNQIENNTITSNNNRISKRGNGIHLFYGSGNVVRGNDIYNVQDGIYIDFAADSTLSNNTISDSRYAIHLMFGKGGLVSGNQFTYNINGMMVMSSSSFRIEQNIMQKQLDYRGYGALLYNTDRITMRGNRIMDNSNGLGLEDARDSMIADNVIAGNHLGLSLLKGNTGTTLSGNQFIGNVVQARSLDDKQAIDDGTSGNYWDDYSSFDLTGDGIGELPYYASSIYDKLLPKQPQLQFYFESPAIQLWNAVNRMLPATSTASGADRFPLTQRPVPQPIADGTAQAGLEGELPADNRQLIGIAGCLFLIGGIFILAQGRIQK